LKCTLTCVTFEEDEWPIATIVNIMKALTLTQNDGESVAEYARRAKAAWEVFFGTITVWADKYHQETTPNFDKKSLDDKTTLNEAAMEMMKAYVLLKNCDTKRFGEPFKDISKSYAYGTKQWPESLDAARKMLEKVKNLSDTHLHPPKEKIRPKASQDQRKSHHTRDPKIRPQMKESNCPSPILKEDAMSVAQEATSLISAPRKIPLPSRNGFEKRLRRRNKHPF
jgi:hypothetical protein